MNLSELERLTKETQLGSVSQAGTIAGTIGGTNLTATNLLGTIGGTIGGTNLTGAADQLQADIKLKTSL